MAARSSEVLTLATLYQQCLEHFQAESHAPSRHVANLRAARDFMRAHYARNIELRDIAQTAHLSSFHFLRLFQRCYGTTPRRYLRDLRLAQAKRLLRSGTSVTEVCLAVGYRSLPTFSVAFRRSVGVSPQQFSRQKFAIQKKRDSLTHAMLAG